MNQFLLQFMFEGNSPSYLRMKKLCRSEYEQGGDTLEMCLPNKCLFSLRSTQIYFQLREAFKT